MINLGDRFGQNQSKLIKMRRHRNRDFRDPVMVKHQNI